MKTVCAANLVFSFDIPKFIKSKRSAVDDFFHPVLTHRVLRIAEMRRVKSKFTKHIPASLRYRNPIPIGRNRRYVSEQQSAHCRVGLKKFLKAQDRWQSSQ
jgi:hypothetical protein